MSRIFAEAEDAWIIGIILVAGVWQLAAVAWRWLYRLDTLTGALTLVAMYLVGLKSPWGWVVGLANQALWIALIRRRKLWGLAPLTLALIFLYSRNLRAWWWP